MLSSACRNPSRIASRYLPSIVPTRAHTLEHRQPRIHSHPHTPEEERGARRGGDGMGGEGRGGEGVNRGEGSKREEWSIATEGQERGRGTEGLNILTQALSLSLLRPPPLIHESPSRITYIYIYIYISIYIYAHTHTYTYTHTLSLPLS
jgi:hypothetical protein